MSRYVLKASIEKLQYTCCVALHTINFIEPVDDNNQPCTADDGNLNICSVHADSADGNNGTEPSKSKPPLFAQFKSPRITAPRPGGLVSKTESFSQSSLTPNIMHNLELEDAVRTEGRYGQAETRTSMHNSAAKQDKSGNMPASSQSLSRSESGAESLNTVTSTDADSAESRAFESKEEDRDVQAGSVEGHGKPAISTVGGKEAASSSQKAVQSASKTPSDGPPSQNKRALRKISVLIPAGDTVIDQGTRKRTHLQGHPTE
ncbi:hypothetical protein BC830DRAFT_459468 [Chytriomyces sp. MP71]|nr:hypothetical protein BC830DRAFT_459468 [Chytriomyces sp. MP71]